MTPGPLCGHVLAAIFAANISKELNIASEVVIQVVDACIEFENSGMPK